MPYAFYVNDAKAEAAVSHKTAKGRKTTMNNRKTILLSIGGLVVLLALAILFLGHWGYGPWTANGGWWPMHHGYSGPGGMMGFGRMGGFSIIFWGLVVLAIALLIAGAMSRKNLEESAKKDVSDSLEILKQRYARGEIDQEEFINKRDILQKSNWRQG